MKIVSRLTNRDGVLDARLSTNDNAHPLPVAAKDDGKGSRANGGELLCLALGACFCNDIYREAAGKNLDVVAVEVEVEADFGGVGEPASRVQYSAVVSGRADESSLRELVEHTDRVTEIQNTLRRGMPVELVSYRVETV